MMMRLVAAWLVAGVCGCGLTEPQGATCDLSDAEAICDPAAVRIVGEVDGRMVDVRAAEDWGMCFPPAWALSLFGENVYISLWTGDRDFAARPASGVFTIDPGGPLYCAAVDGCVSADDGTAMARLDSLGELGTCPGPIPIAGEVTGCLGSWPDSGCTVSGGPLFAGEEEVFGYGVGAASGLISVQAMFMDGRMVDGDSERGGGTLVYMDQVFCIGDMSINTDDPEHIAFAFRELTTFAPCDESPAVSGSLRVCAPF